MPSASATTVIDTMTSPLRTGSFVRFGLAGRFGFGSVNGFCLQVKHYQSGH